MNKELFQRYAEIKRLMKVLEEEASGIAPQLIEEMGDNQQVELGTALFSISKRKTWTYTEDVAQARESVKNMEAREKADGSATYEETTSITMREKAEK
jgi:hypothetical protein